MDASKVTVAFIGSTGGCANSCLAFTLKAGFKATALVRTPSKLEGMLLEQDGITKDVLEKQLTIVQGDGTNQSDMKKVLTTDNGTKLVSMIVSGIGGVPVRQGLSFVFPNPHITEQATQALLNALSEIYAENPSFTEKPLITVISSTGISKQKPNDVPLLMRPLYSMLLATPHQDKMKMEELLEQDTTKTLFSGVVVIRPSFLTGTHVIKLNNKAATVKYGNEDEPAVGYTIDRADVGAWIFEKIINSRSGSEFLGHKITLTK